MEEKLVARGAKIGTNYRVNTESLEPENVFNKDHEKIMRVLYIAQHNTTGEYLVAWCPFNYIEKECESIDVVDNVIMIPISIWRKIATRRIEVKNYGD